MFVESFRVLQSVVILSRLDSINVSASIAHFRYNVILQQSYKQSRRSFVATLLKANAWQLDRQVVNVHDRVIHRLTCVLVKLADGLMIQQVLRVGTSKFDGGAARFFVRNTLKGPGDELDTKTVRRMFRKTSQWPKSLFTKPSRHEFLFEALINFLAVSQKYSKLEEIIILNAYSKLMECYFFEGKENNYQ